jgi:hypothetical protein
LTLQDNMNSNTNITISTADCNIGDVEVAADCNIGDIEVTTDYNIIDVEVNLSQGPQGPAGVNTWGSLLGSLSAQTDLWSYLSAEPISVSQLTAFLVSNFITLSDLDVKGQLLSAGIDLFDIFLTSETDSQTLSFNEGTNDLSILNGNTISLSSLSATSGSGREDVNTLVIENSGNWNEAYNIGTVYSSVSSSFATNTTLESVSSLLTPLTLTDTLTSQLVLNTDFDSYKTEVAAATATLQGQLETITITASTPAEITADQNNYAPSLAPVLRLSSDAARTITGLAGGDPGRAITVINVGVHNITLARQSASSDAENRFLPVGTTGDFIVVPNGAVGLWYDGTTERWRVL